jgi:hypothetical protein
MKKVTMIAEMGRYTFYKNNDLFNVKIDDIWFFDWKQAAKSLGALLSDLHREQQAYERYYNEADIKMKELYQTIEELKSGNTYLEDKKEDVDEKT